MRNARFAVLWARRRDESKAVARRLFAIRPNFHVRPIMEFMAFMGPQPVRTHSAGLREAGLPE